jgi:hypothetical protein
MGVFGRRLPGHGGSGDTSAVGRTVPPAFGTDPVAGRGVADRMHLPGCGVGVASATAGDLGGNSLPSCRGNFCTLCRMRTICLGFWCIRQMVEPFNREGLRGYHRSQFGVISDRPISVVLPGSKHIGRVFSILKKCRQKRMNVIEIS